MRKNFKKIDKLPINVYNTHGVYGSDCPFSFMC